MSKIVHCRFSTLLSVALAFAMVWPTVALAVPDGSTGTTKTIIISDKPGDYKISLGKAEGAKVGAKGVISRRGEDIAKFEVTSVDWGYSRIAVSDLAPGTSIRINDSAKVTETPKANGEQKIKKKDSAAKILGGLLLIGAIIAIAGGGGGGGDGGTGGGGTVADITLASNKTSISADGTSTANITATVVDRNNAAVPDGTKVHFSATLGAINPAEATTVGGVATATLTAGTTAGLCAVTATASTKSKTLNISFVPVSGGQPGSIQLLAAPTSIQVLGSTGGVTESAITATCRDAQGNLATSGTVTFSSTIGSINGNAVISPTGVATATFSSNTTGQATITATWEGATATINVMVTSGPPYTIQAEVSPGAIENDGHSFATVTATVRDIAGNSVTDGTKVTFTDAAGVQGQAQPDVLGGGNGSVTPEAHTTNGVATAILISRSPAGATSVSGTATVYVRVPVSQSAGIPAPAVALENHETQVQFTSLDAAAIVVGANPLNIRGWDRIGRTSAIRADVLDSRHNPVPDGTAVYFTTEHGMIFGTTGMAGKVALSLTHLGTAMATLSSLGSEEGGWGGFVTVTATSGPVTWRAENLVIFSGAPLKDNCSRSMNPTQLENCQDAAVISVTVHDVNNRPVVDGTSVQISATKGTLSESAPTTVGGQVQVTLSTSQDCANPTATGTGRVSITIRSDGDPAMIMDTLEYEVVAP